MNEKLKMTDVTSEFDPEDIQKNKAMGILSFLYLLVLIPIFKAKDSKYARYNANQGLVLSIVMLALNIINALFGNIRFIGWIFRIVCYLGAIPVTVLMIIGFVNAIRGLVKKLPIVGDIQILK